PWCRESKRAARLLLCRLLAACEASRLAGGLQWPAGPGGQEGWGEAAPAGGAGRLGRAEAMMPVQRLICFCRYFLWFTFLLDLTGLSRASLMLLDAESMKLSRSLVASLKSPGSSPPPTPPPPPPRRAAPPSSIAACTAIAARLLCPWPLLQLLVRSAPGQGSYFLPLVKGCPLWPQCVCSSTKGSALKSLFLKFDFIFQ
uniref:Uncharacterized protein n=1 Tax=Terrapene triunguis TaxID=2587831 RepID=A0A674JQG2_9SAUR